jgi:dTDP-4-amino-4,6-dideoxygalactose transaminase
VIRFVDLRKKYLRFKVEIDSAVLSVLHSCQFTLGPEVVKFEEEFAAYSHSGFGIGVNSGTSALHLALLAAGIGPGDEVITTPFTFVATVAAIHYTGARTVFVDVESRTCTIDPDRIEAAITPRTRAIIPVHLFGQPADMDPIMTLARKHGLIVVEDACQAHGAEYKGRRVGSIGDLGCFSFYPGKNLGAYGEGGLVTTQNSEYNRTVRMLRDWGAQTKYQHVLKGYNYRLEEIQGAVLRVKLKYLEQWTEARRGAAALYDNCFAHSAIDAPTAMPYARHVYHIYAIRVRERAACQKALQARDIHTGIHYPIPIHLLPAYADLGYRAGEFPQAEKAANEVLSLPMFPEITAQQIESVARAVRESGVAAAAPAHSRLRVAV